MQIYLDMDGLLSDHDKHLCDLMGVKSVREASSDDIISVIRAPNFFRTMPKTLIADELISKVIELHGEYSIITTPNSGCRMACIIDKFYWVKENLINKPTKIIFTDNKSSYAQGNILIDDYRPNITAWRKAGGAGIKFKANSSNYTLADKIEELKHYYSIL